MESISNSKSRFRFRDHNQELGEDGSSEGHTSADSSSISSNEYEESELQSMTAKGVQHLCSELLELKQESDEDFQKNIFSNYSAFLAILKDIESLGSELEGLKYQASSQKRLLRNFSDGIYLKVLSEETIETLLEEPLHLKPSSPSILETHTENVSEVLDTLLSEHRLDDALVLLDMEGEFFQNLWSGEIFSSDQLMSYNSTISEKRAMLSDKLTLVAKHPRVSAPELQKAFLGLCQLGDSHLATQLLLQYYHSRIASGIHNLQSSEEFLDMLYIQEVAKLVCSMISQAARSFEALNGGNHTHASELTQWADQEIEVFASCFSKYIASISEISGKLSIAVDAMQIAMSYCPLLETQRLFLQPSMIENICPCIEEVLRIHIDHLSKIIGIFTLTDTWVLGRYFVSGILTKRNYAIVDQQPEHIFLSNSGRKFVTVFQSVTEDISPLIPLQMESSVLKGIIDLFTAYIDVLESALTDNTNIIQKEELKINLPETITQEVFILANLSALMQFCSSIIRNIFDGIPHLDCEIDSHLSLIQDVYARLKASFLEQFVKNIFSPNVDRACGSESCIEWLDNSKIYDMVPSVPHLELYLQLKKLEKLAEDDCIDMNWLMDLLRELMDGVFEWISSKSKILTIDKEDLANHRAEFLQFILDAQFLVEIARRGGYLCDNVINASLNFVSQLEASFISAGLNPLRVLNDDEWPANTAIKALQKLQKLEAKESEENEDVESITGEESNKYESQLVNDLLFEDRYDSKLGKNSIESANNQLVVSASEFDDDDTETKVSRDENTPFEVEVLLEEQKINTVVSMTPNPL